MRCFHNPILPGALISSFPRRILYHPWNLRLAFLSYPESDIHGYDDLPVHVQVGIIFSGHEYAFAFRFRQTAGNCWSFWHSSSSQLIMSSARGTNTFFNVYVSIILENELVTLQSGFHILWAELALCCNHFWYKTTIEINYFIVVGNVFS